MSILNLRKSQSPELPGEETAATGEVESVREMLQSGEPPGLDRIRRFVVKPRPRLWKFGVGVWLWIKRIAQWVLRLLKWIGELTVRLRRAARLAAFVGRRAQNLGARIGAVGRNWSSAEGRLGSAGGGLSQFGARLVGGGAALAQVGDGVTELTKRAAGFLAVGPDPGGAKPHLKEAPVTGTPPAPPSRRGRRRAATSPPDPQPPTTESDAPSARSEAGSPKTVPAPPVPANPPEAPSSDPPSVATATDRSPLPDDLPFYLRNQIENLSQLYFHPPPDDRDPPQGRQRRLEPERGRVHLLRRHRDLGPVDPAIARLGYGLKPLVMSLSCRYSGRISTRNVRQNRSHCVRSSP